MDALSRWTFRALLVLLATTSYVQIVGKRIETMSGLDRLQNLGIYRHLFGGAPWVQWYMFRYSGIIQVGGTIAVFVLFGWKIGVVFIIAALIFCILGWRVANGHAAQMLADLAKRAHDEEPG